MSNPVEMDKRNYYSSSNSSSHDSSLSDQFSSIEKTASQFYTRISALNSNIEKALRGRSAQTKVTNTLRLLLRNCISEITSLLAEMDEMANPSGTPNFDQMDERWEVERTQLTEKRRELEQRLASREANGPITKKHTKAKFDKKIANAAKEKFKEDKSPTNNEERKLKRSNNSKNPITLNEEEAMEEALINRIGSKKLGRMMDRVSMSIQKPLPKANEKPYGRKRTQKDISADHKQDPSLPFSKKVKSAPSKKDINLSPKENLLAKLNNLSNNDESDSSYTSGDSSECDEKTRYNLPGTSAENLLEKLNSLNLKENSESSTSFESSDTSRSAQENTNLDKSNPITNVKGNSKKNSPRESKAASQKNTPQTKLNTSMSPGIEKKKDSSTKNHSNKSKSKSSDKSRDPILRDTKVPKIENEEEKKNEPNIGLDTKDLLQKLNQFKKESKPKRSSDRDSNSGKPGSTSKSATKTSQKVQKENPKKSESTTTSPIATDVGGNTFELFRKMNELRNNKMQTNLLESDDDETPQTVEPIQDDRDIEPAGLIEDFAVREDMNKAGMIKGKKHSTNLRGQKKIYQMEDAHYCAYPFQKLKELGLFCVFDGHAGKECATKLTTLFPKYFFKYWQNLQNFNKEELNKLWNQVYKNTDDHLKEFLYEGSTSTTVVIFKKDGKRYLQSANVGDSSAYLYRDNKAISLTQDHKPTDKSERQRIAQMGIKLEENATRLNGIGVSRALGDHFPKEINSGIIGEPYLSDLYELTPKDTRLIVASDGLWDVISATRAYEVVKSTKDASEAAKRLLKVALNSNKCYDNITIIVVNLK